MKRTITLFALALLVCALSGVVASAKVKSHLVSFGQDFVAGGTVVKHGTYLVSFDDQTNKLTISDKKTKAVLATVTVRQEERTSQRNGLEIDMLTNGDSVVMRGVAFPGDKQKIVIVAS